MEVLDILNKGWFSVLVTVAIAIVSYKYGKQRSARPTALLKVTRELTWGKAEEIPSVFKVSFQNQQITRLTRGALRIWNDGNETLNGNLIPEKDQLRVEIENGEILLAVALKQSKEVNNCSITIDEANKKVAYISFDYLDPREGGLFVFLHTSTVTTPIIKGTIKGHRIRFLDTPLPMLRDILFNPKIVPAIRKTLPWFLLFSGATIVALSQAPEELKELFRGPSSPPTPEESKRYLKGFLAFFGLTYICAGLYLFWAKRRKYPKELETGT